VLAAAAGRGRVSRPAAAVVVVAAAAAAAVQARELCRSDRLTCAYAL